MYPANAPELADLIDGSIGEGSPFHERFGYYAQGVGPETAVLPKGWQNRLVRVQNQNTDLKVGLCLEPHDLAAAKLYAGREKDWHFVQEMLMHRLIEPGLLSERIGRLSMSLEHQARLQTSRVRHQNAKICDFRHSASIKSIT